MRRERGFADRAAAGAALAGRLRTMDWVDPVVLGMARGGVPVAAAVAAALRAPLDVLVACKIGLPAQPELAVGAVTADGPVRFDLTTVWQVGLRRDQLEAAAVRARQEARRRLQEYRSRVTPVALAGRDVVLVDDGLATGLTARVALEEVRAAAPRRAVFAAPVCAPESVAALRDEGLADEVICLLAPPSFRAVGEWYREFGQVGDQEVLDAVADAARLGGPTPSV